MQRSIDSSSSSRFVPMATERNNYLGSGRFNTFSSGVFFSPSFTNKEREGGGKERKKIKSFPFFFLSSVLKKKKKKSP